jgi:hypothetical protein
MMLLLSFAGLQEEVLATVAYRCLPAAAHAEHAATSLAVTTANSICASCLWKDAGAQAGFIVPST